MLKKLSQIVTILSFLVFSQMPCYAFDNSPTYDDHYQYGFIDKNAKEILTTLQALLNDKQLSAQQRYFITHNLAYAYFRLNDKSLAIEKFTDSITLAEKVASYHQARSLWRRAMTYGILFRDTDTAITDLTRALNLIEKSPEKSLDDKTKRLKIDLLTSMSQAYNQKAQLLQAAEYINKAIMLASEHHYKEDKIYALIILGRIYWQQNEIQQAASAYLQALNLTDKNTPPRRIASIEIRLANVYLSQGIFNQSLIHAQKSVDLYQTLDNPRMKIKSIAVLASIYFEIDENIDLAINHYLNALDIAIQINDPHSIGELRHSIGKAYLKANNLPSAEKYLLAAKTILESSVEQYYVGLNDIELARLQGKLGNTSVAISMLESLMQSNKLVPYPDSIYIAENLLVNLYSNSNQYEKAYIIQAKLLENERDSKRRLNDNFVGQLTNEITLKSLLTEQETLTVENQKINTKMNNISRKNHYYLAVIGVTFLGMIFLYSQLHQIKKRYRTYKKTHTLTWPYFWQHLHTAINNQNIKKNKNASSGLLVSFPCTSIDAKQVSGKFQENELIDTWHEFLADKFPHNKCVWHHQELWLSCAEKPTFDQKLIKELREKSALLNVKLVWLGLNNLPEKISEDTLTVIQKIIYQVGSEYNLASNVQISDIELATNALPMIFSALDERGKFDIDKGIEIANSAGTVITATREL
ncbi:tetratricopeptide repeat protein [Colwelliaceae bacterium 6471]